MRVRRAARWKTAGNEASWPDNIRELISPPSRKARRAAQSKAKGQKHKLPSRPNKSGKTFDR